jgi:diphosphomevalonate decarboxylase
MTAVARAIAHPNIALVKYWGKRDVALNLPAVSSLSLTLEGFSTETTVRWGAAADSVVFQGKPAPEGFARKVLKFLDRIDGKRPPVEVITTNDFPSGAGLASSASGFAALTVAAVKASGVDLDVARQGALARQGSGSACRSLHGGFVRWDKGVQADGSDSIPVPIAPVDHWDLRMVVAVVSEAEKAVGSTEGMDRSRATSPYWEPWLATSDEDVVEAERAVRARDLEALGVVMERSCFKMHATMHTATPPLLYWQPASIAALHVAFGLRQQGVGAWVTMDAGPQVKVLCATADAPRVAAALGEVVPKVHVLGPGAGARLVP